MSTPDFFRSRLDGMVDSRHPLVVLTGRLPWAQIEQVLAPHFARKAAPRAPRSPRTCWASTRSNSAVASAAQAGRACPFG